MPKERSKAAVKDGWLCLQGSQQPGSGKLVRAVLTEASLALYTAPPSRVARPVASDIGASSAVLPASSIAHRSIDPHPDLASGKQPSPEALAHLLLFGTEPPASYAAFVFAAPADEVAHAMHLYVELLLDRALVGAESGTVDGVYPPTAVRTAEYCLAVLEYHGLVLNERVLAAVHRLVSSLGSLDAQRADQLKLAVVRAQEGAQKLWQQALAPQAITAPPNSAAPWMTRLQRASGSGIPPDVMLDNGFIAAFADQVAAYHRRIWRCWSPTSDLSLLFHTPQSASVWRLNPLVFDVTAPHFLGMLAAQHALSTGLSETVRAKLLEQWIALAARLRVLGDSVGWLGVATVLFDMSIMRLSTVWRHADLQSIAQLTDEWGFEVFELRKRAGIPFMRKTAFRTDAEGLGRSYAKDECVPYFGDAVVTETGGPDMTTRQLVRLKAILEGWRVYYDAAPNDVSSVDVKEDATIQRLLLTWSQQPITTTDLSGLSLIAQPRLLGHYLAHFYNQSLPLTSGGMLPLLFTEAVPSFRLFPRGALLLASQPKVPQKNQLRRTSSFPPASGPSLATGVSEVESDARETFENVASVHVLARVVRDLLNVGTETIDTRLGLVFKSFPDEETGSRGSRTSSIIETLGRRPPQGRQVVVKSASLVRLVDVLVLGASKFGHGLTLDTKTHRSTLLASYRSFCSPAELLEMFQTRVRGARHAAYLLGVSKGHHGGQLWTPSAPKEPSDAVSQLVLTNVLETLQMWITDYFFDFADDSRVMDAGKALLGALKAELEAAEYPESIYTLVRRTTGLFLRYQFKVSTLSSPPPPSWVSLLHKPRNIPLPELPVTSLEPDGGLALISGLIDELNLIVSDAFSRITLVDWMKLFEILELQTASRTGLFCYAPSSHTSETEVQVQDVYSWLSTLQTPGGKTRVLDVLPEPISALVKLYNGLVAYFTTQIADPGLTQAHDRQDRMSFILKMLGILRARMRFFDLFPEFGPNSINPHQNLQSVPSFLERAVVAAVLRPESRGFVSSWIAAGADVARIYPGQSEDLGAPNARTLFIPSISTASGQPLTPCVGWMIERLLEIVCCVPNTSVYHPDLINFDKRRYSYNLVKNMCGEFQAQSAVTAPWEVVRKHAYLFGDATAQGYVPTPVIERRLLKECVARENPGRSGKMRVFVDVIAQEIEKIKLEARQFDRLSQLSAAANSSSVYGLPASQSSTSLYSRRFSRLLPSNSAHDVSGGLSHSAGAPLSTAPPPTSPPRRQSAQSQHKRSRLGGLLKAVRPLSMISSSVSSTHISPPSSATIPSGPTMESHPTGSSVSLQSQPEEEENEWVADESVDLEGQVPAGDLTSDWKKLLQIDIENVGDVVSRGAALFAVMYKVTQKSDIVVLRASSPELAQEWVQAIYSGVRRVLLQSTRVFGVPLDIVCAREHSKIPVVLEVLLSRVEERGLDEVGVYRISGSLAAVNTLKALFDQGKTKLKPDDSRWSDIHAVAGCIKLYLRELPQPILTTELFPEFLEAASVTSVDTERLRRVLEKLPAPNFHVLDRLSAHLRLVVNYASVNKMSVQNIAIVFSVNFLPQTAMDQMGRMQQIVNALVLQRDELFGP